MKKLNASLIKIVTMLNDGEYHDGPTIGKRCKMTRSAVWKAMKKLEKYGIAIHSFIKEQRLCLSGAFDFTKRTKNQTLFNSARS